VSAKTIFAGFGIGLAYKSAMSAFRLWKDTPEKVFKAPFDAGSVAVEISPELLGVGYIIGPAIAGLMAGGGVLAYLVLIPMIKYFGAGLAGPLAPGTKLISAMSPGDVRGAYVLYIGAGAVAAAGIISLFRSLPVIVHGLKEGLRDVRGGSKNSGANALRTDRDLDSRFVFGGVGLLILAILLSPSLHMNLLGALLIVIFGFLFVTVSSRLTGEIGSSSNPISGMTVATLLLTCLIFLLVGWVGASWYVTALSVGGIVCIAASNGGTTSQDLKTGYLVGATPRHQQVSIIIGSMLSAVLLGPILMKLNETATVYVPGDRGRTRRLPCGRLAAREREDRAREGRAGRERREHVPHLSQDRQRGRARGQVPGRRERRREVARGPGHQRHAHEAARRHRGEEVRRPEGHAHELHHPRHPRPQAAVGAGAVRRHDLGRARAGRDPVARLRGGRVPAALLVVADLRRRHGALARGSRAREEARAQAPHARAARRGGRQEPGRAHGLRLHRRRRDRGHPDRVPWPACSRTSTTRSPAGRRRRTRSSPAGARTRSR
jgi:hypothetical protein